MNSEIASKFSRLLISRQFDLKKTKRDGFARPSGLYF